MNRGNDVGLMNRRDVALVDRRHMSLPRNLYRHRVRLHWVDGDDHRSSLRRCLSDGVAVLVGASAREMVGERVRRGRLGAECDGLSDDTSSDLANRAVGHRVRARSNSIGLRSRHNGGLHRRAGDRAVGRCCRCGSGDGMRSCSRLFTLRHFRRARGSFLGAGGDTC